ncbi:hypothetical protein ACWC5G_36335, partial [Streptomyces sp. NPDC001274]
MAELRGSHKAHFWLALVFAGVGALCVGSTWLPGGQAPPKWLEVVWCLAVFPVFAPTGPGAPVLASATAAEPSVAAGRLTGLPVQEVADDSSPR